MFCLLRRCSLAPALPNLRALPSPTSASAPSARSPAPRLALLCPRAPQTPVRGPQKQPLAPAPAPLPCAPHTRARTPTMEAPKPAAKYALSSFYTSRFSSSASPAPSPSGLGSGSGPAGTAQLNGGTADDRKRKITDKNLPGGLAQEPEFAAESAMYRDLLQMERRLDWTMTRKRVEIHDALQRLVPVSL